MNESSALTGLRVFTSHTWHCMQAKINLSEARDREDLNAFCNSTLQACQPLTKRAAAIQSGVHLPQEKPATISPLHTTYESKKHAAGSNDSVQTPNPAYNKVSGNKLNSSNCLKARWWHTWEKAKIMPVDCVFPYVSLADGTGMSFIEYPIVSHTLGRSAYCASYKVLGN